MRSEQVASRQDGDLEICAEVNGGEEQTTPSAASGKGSALNMVFSCLAWMVVIEIIELMSSSNLVVEIEHDSPKTFEKVTSFSFCI